MRVTLSKRSIAIAVAASLFASLIGTGVSASSENGGTKPLYSLDGLKTEPKLDTLNVLFRTVRQAHDRNSAEIVDWIVGNADFLPPGFFFELSRRLFRLEKQLAVEWYVVAQVRSQYDALRCREALAPLSFALLPIMTKEVLRYQKAQRSEFNKAARVALARSDLFSERISPLWTCRFGVFGSKIDTNARDNDIGNEIVSDTQWPRMRRRILAYYRKEYSARSSSKKGD